jgi:uncharacterized protein YndB with AHSA1/START domain
MYGTLEQTSDGRSRLRFVRILRHPPERVWLAITEPEQLAQWFPTTIEGELAAGASLRFSFPGGQLPAFDGEMLAYQEGRLLEFSWGTDVLRLELRPAAEGTELTLLDTLDERGKAARDGAGWHVCLDGLERSLGGVATSPQSSDAWNAVHPHYVEEFGPEAATIGPPEGFE